MLHEASTVLKAIEQAWQESGKPTEFTIKVLELGKKSVLWFSKQRAIVSITYDPKKQTVSTKKTDISKEKSFKQTIKGDSNKKIQVQTPKKTESFSKSIISTTQWTNEGVNHISTNLKELLIIANLNVTFSTKVENKRLYINFPKRILPLTEEKMFFISLSFLLMQFIKKDFKKKFRGFSIFIKSKESARYDQK